MELRAPEVDDDETQESLAVVEPLADVELVVDDLSCSC